MRRLLGFGVAFALFGAACSSSTSHTGSDAGSLSSGQTLEDASLIDGSDSLCATDPRAESFVSGIQAKGASGAASVTIDSATPSTPIKGNNEWIVSVTDAQGAPLDGLTITVSPFMPDHGHGSSITPQIAPLGGGKYDITLINLFMPGIWQITLTLATPGDGGQAQAIDSAVFTFCISG
ncbi:MAG TPA: FixH family protein [Polyangiaceae bacterium]